MKTLETFSVECVTIQDVIEHNDLDGDATIDTLLDSDISFGTNTDTLVAGDLLCRILDKDLDFGQLDKNKVLVSLGC